MQCTSRTSGCQSGLGFYLAKQHPSVQHRVRTKPCAQYRHVRQMRKSGRSGCMLTPDSHCKLFPVLAKDPSTSGGRSQHGTTWFGGSTTILTSIEPGQVVAPFTTLTMSCRTCHCRRCRRNGRPGTTEPPITTNNQKNPTNPPVRHLSLTSRPRRRR